MQTSTLSQRTHQSLKLSLMMLWSISGLIACIPEPRFPTRDPDEIRESLLPSELPIDESEPCLLIDEPDLDLGDIVRGDTAQKAITVTACAWRSVSLDGLRVVELSESIRLEPPTLPLTLEPNESVTIAVHYQPQIAGEDRGRLNLKSDTDGVYPIKIKGRSLPPPIEEIGLHIKLEWDTEYSDIDLHLVAQGGHLNSCFEDCHFRNQSPRWGDPLDRSDDPYLDLDDVDGLGPENINLSRPKPGIYQVYVHDYQHNDAGLTTPVIEIISYGEVLAVLELEDIRDNEAWLVAEIEITEPDIGGPLHYRVLEVGELLSEHPEPEICQEVIVND